MQQIKHALAQYPSLRAEVLQNVYFYYFKFYFDHRIHFERQVLSQPHHGLKKYTSLDITVDRMHLIEGTHHTLSHCAADSGKILIQITLIFLQLPWDSLKDPQTGNSWISIEDLLS